MAETTASTLAISIATVTSGLEERCFTGLRDLNGYVAHKSAPLCPFAVPPLRRRRALLDAGYTDEALAFRDFLLRVGTGDPRAIQIMLGDVSGQEAAEGE